MSHSFSKPVMLSVILLCVGFVQAVDGDGVQSQIKNYRNMSYLVVSPNGPDDGGDFGPKSPGTKTSGIQEALNYAKEHSRDVYIVGGGIKEAFKGGVGYRLDETLRIPWNQNWRLDGGEYWLSYAGETGDAVVIDSQMNCDIKLGLVVASRSPDCAIRMYPTTKGPDKLCCIVASTFRLNGAVGAGDVWGKPGCVQKGTGLKLDNSGGGGINGNTILMKEINACDIGVDILPGCSSNHFEITWSHLTNLGMRIGKGVSESIIKIGASGDVPNARGVQIYGQNNFLTLTAHNHAPGKNLIFEESARDNLIIAVNLSEGITNNAAVPTNRIISTSAIGYSIETPIVPESGKELVNREPYTVEVRVLNPGQVNGWTQTDAKGTALVFSSGLITGQSFILDPGDKIKFDYSKAPSWKWKALR